MTKTQKTQKQAPASNAATALEELKVGLSELDASGILREPGSVKHADSPITQAIADVLTMREDIRADETLQAELRDGEFALAGVCYAMTPAWREHKDRHDNALMRTLWPLPLYQFNPTPDDRRAELVNAAALLITEIERMDAAAAGSADA